MISIQYDHIDTQYGWRRRRALSPFFFVALSLFLVRSRSLSFFSLWMGAQRKKKEIERNINYWIRIVYCLNNSTWFVVYEYVCAAVRKVWECIVLRRFSSLPTHSLSFSVVRLSTWIIAVGSGRQTRKNERAFVSRTSQRKREEFSLSFSTNAMSFDLAVISIGYELGEFRQSFHLVSLRKKGKIH